MVPAQILLNHRQRMYAYRVLSLPEDHPTKEILPVSFRKGDGDTQPGDQPEDTLLWASNDRANTYGQWLARQVFLTGCIDPAYGVEPVERVKNPNEDLLMMHVIIEPAGKATAEAKTYQTTGMVLWTDGSKLMSGKSGAAVVWRNKRSNSWHEKKRYLGKMKQPLDTELWAISEALEVASKETDNVNATPVTVFTDSKAALTKIQKKTQEPEGLAVRVVIHQRAKELISRGHSITLHWFPGHSKVEGNERADLAAKKAAEKGGLETDCWSSLTHVRTELKKTRLAELSTWHQVKTQERETSRRGFYISQAKCGISSTLGKAPKKIAARYYQLKTGHGAFGAFLARIGALDTPKCWWCNAREQTVVHLYTECRRWRKERRKLIRELKKHSINWQSRAEKRWLAELLANEQAVGPLLKFLKSTEIGCREGAVGRELEWEQGRDQEGENQLED